MVTKREKTKNILQYFYIDLNLRSEGWILIRRVKNQDTITRPDNTHSVGKCCILVLARPGIHYKKIFGEAPRRLTKEKNTFLYMVGHI